MRYGPALFLALAAVAASAPASATRHHHPTRAAKTNAAPAPAPQLRYYGGPVIANVKIVAVFWGPTVDRETTSKIGDFYKDFVASSAFDWLGEYDTTVKAVDGKRGTDQHIGKGTFVKAVTITPSEKGAPLTDPQIGRELKAQIAAGALPKPDDDTLYVIHFPPRQKIKLPGTGMSCKDFCAYHQSFANKAPWYAVMPDQSKGSGCDVGCGNAGSFGNLTASAAHEIIEAVTDPAAGVNGKPRAPLAWYDPDKDAKGDEYAEIGDICSDYEAKMVGPSGHTWTTQKMWSNAANGCIVKKGDRPQGAAAATSTSGTRPSNANTKGTKAAPAKSKPARRPIAG